LADADVAVVAVDGRLAIAQAYLEEMVLVTQDQLMRPYGVATLGLD
jgi:PIN domain nuclease of toxin-antitoxin system